jgi:acyl-CoA synthetase (NDP forming)
MASISGGACAMYADLAHIHGLEVPPYAAETQAKLREILPGFAATLNPLDVTGVVVQDPTIWSRAIPALKEDPGMGLIVASTVVPVVDREIASMGGDLKAIAAGFKAANAKPVMLSMTLQDQSDLQRDFLREIEVDAVLPGIEVGVKALAHLQRWSENLLGDAPRTLDVAAEATRPTGEREVLSYLAGKGAPVIPSRLVKTAEEAAEAAVAVGGNAVLKIASPDIAHKTEAGGVRLNVAGGEAAARVFEEIVRSAKAYAPNARIDGVIVSPMREAGVELIAGVARDPEWGPVIVVGLGGIFTEALKDSQVRLLPVSTGDVKAALKELKGAKLLEGFRGAPAADLDKLAVAIVAIGDAALALGPHLAALEVNPLRVRGGEVECLDGLAVYEG